MTTGPGEAEPAVSVRSLCWALFRTDGTIRLDDVTEVGHSLGLSEQAIRHGVRRLCEREGFEREGRGRNAIVRAGAHGNDLWDLDRELVHYAHRQDTELEPWDGRWRLVTFSIPEPRRADRDRIRGWLRSMGAATVSHATYVSPHDWWEVVLPLVDDLDLTEFVTWAELDRLVVAGIEQPTAIADHLWPRDALDATYAGTLALVEQARSAWDDLDAGARLLAWVTATIDLIDAFEIDPLLPSELAPPAGRAARLAYRSLTERLLADVEGSDQYGVALQMTRPITDRAPSVGPAPGAGSWRRFVT